MNEIGSKILNFLKVVVELDWCEGGFVVISVIGVFLVLVCCIVLLFLVIFGVLGVWIGNLMMFEFYKFYIVVVIFVLFGFGFW